MIANPNAAWQKELGWKSSLGIPLKIEGQVSGILEVYSREARRDYSLFHQDLFKTFSGQAAIAIGHYRSRERAEMLNRITHEAAEASDMDSLLKLLLREGLKISGSSRGWVSRFNPQTGEQTIVDFSGGLPNRQPLKHDGDITGEALRRKTPINAGDVKEPPWNIYYRPRWQDTRSELAVPILVQNAEARIGNKVERKSLPTGTYALHSTL